MNEERDIRKEAYKLNFLYKKINLPYPLIQCWLSVPEFLEVMLDKVNHSEKIDESTIYPVMKNIYEQMLPYKSKKEGREFNYYSARRAIKKLESILNE